jgi:hypothetical protein
MARPPVTPQRARQMALAAAQFSGAAQVRAGRLERDAVLARRRLAAAAVHTATCLERTQRRLGTTDSAELGRCDPSQAAPGTSGRSA